MAHTKQSRNESWIIIDLSTKKALYGLYGCTIELSSYEIAKEVAEIFFTDFGKYLIVSISE